MAASVKPTTVVSTKGQVIVPKTIRERQHWLPGTRLTVEEVPEGVLLRMLPAFAPTRSAEVFGSLAYVGPAKTLEEMDAAVAAEAKRRNAGDRH